MKRIKEIIQSANNGEEITDEEKNEMFMYFRHIPNARKTDEEFELYSKMAKERGIPTPNRKSYIRPLHEKHDKNGKLII